MAIPQFHNEGPDQQGGSTSLTVSFTGLTWSANDIIEIIIATDGWTPVLTTANGFALAQDPVGNTASQTTNGTTVGTNECGIHVYWKRAVGSTTTTDPVPVFQAPSAVSGTSWSMQVNSFSGARTSGTPYTAIAKGTVTTATTAVTSQAATWSLANCLLMPRVASANDDSAFNSWTMSGSSGPSGTGAPNTGWHTSTGNACAFTGDEGGYATGQTAKTATTAFATSTRQAMVTLVMASVAEPAGITANEAASLSPSSSGSTAAVAVTGSLATSDDASVGSSAAGVTVTATETAGLAPSTSSITGSTITSTGTVAATLAPTLASSAANLTGGPTGNEAATLAPSSAAATGTVLVTGSEAAVLTPSAGVSAASVLVTGNESAADGASQAAAAGTVFTPATLALGAQAFVERANTATPTTGTLTTRTVYPAWAPSTTYAIRTDDRVTNAGNTYEAANSGNTGTSASSGSGPTTTPAPVTNGAVTDGSMHWNFGAAGTGAVNTQASGSVILVSLGQGNDAGSGSTAPSDNKGNSYTQIIRSTFAGFPQSSAVTWANAAAAGGTGHTFSAPWTAGLDGGGDEKTIAAVEVMGGTRIVDKSTIEATPNGSNVCTSNTVTVGAGPAELVCFCWLNGTTQPDGFLHTAIPGSGFSLLPLAGGLLEIGNGAGQVHMCTIARSVVGPGTFSASLTTAGTEGAVMHLIAVQGPPGIAGTEAAVLSPSTGASAGTVTTPRIGTEAAVLAPSTGAAAGTVVVTGSSAAADDGSRATAAGVVVVTGTAAISLGASLGASSATLIPVITGTEAAALAPSLATSFGSVISGHAADVAGTLGGSIVAAAGTVLVACNAAAADDNSSTASAAQAIVTGAASILAGGTIEAARGIVGGGVVPRLIGSLATHGQLTATLQLLGVTVTTIEGPITVFVGDTAEYLLTVTKDDGTRFNLSSATSIEFQVKDVDGGTVLVDKTLAGGIQLLDQSSPDTAGQAVITLDSGDTATVGRLRANAVVVAPGLRQHVVAPRDFIVAAV